MNKIPLNVHKDEMTLREYFAAKAMQSLLVEDYRIYKYEVVQRAYEMADLMLEERSK